MKKSTLRTAGIALALSSVSILIAAVNMLICAINGLPMWPAITIMLWPLYCQSLAVLQKEERTQRYNAAGDFQKVKTLTQPTVYALIKR